MEKKRTSTKALPAKKPQIKEQTHEQQPLERLNFIIMICAGVAIILGFVLMLGKGSSTEEFNPDIFSVRRIVIGPLFAFLGFVAMAVAIIVRPRDKKAREIQKQD